MLSEDESLDNIYFQMLLKVPYSELSYSCINNPIFNSICTDPHFWKMRLFQDF